jgi:DNA-binding winged helix-turn-helix (wHTH) protein
MRDEASPAIPRIGEEGGTPSAGIEFGSVREPSAMPARRVISFGPFHLFPEQQLLLEGETPVRLGSRALDILVALVERPGKLIGKAELMARIWPGIVVEESNLKVQISGLRRALSDGRDSNRYIATIPGRGYRFVAPVMFSEEPVRLASSREREAG